MEVGHFTGWPPVNTVAPPIETKPKSSDTNNIELRHKETMGESFIQVPRYQRKDGTWVRGHTKTVTTVDRSLQKVRGSRGGIKGLASREPEAEDVIFALDPETSSWSQAGFTHDSNWLVWHLNGYTPKEAARNQKAGRQPGLLEYGKLYEYVEANPNFNWEDFPARHLTDISYLFETWNFNESIEHFDVSNIVNMQSLFEENEIFNQPLNSWDVSKVENMSAMFAGAIKFNQPLNNWDVSNVEDMRSMFCVAYNFDQNLGDLGHFERHRHGIHLFSLRYVRKESFANVSRVGETRRYERSLKNYRLGETSRDCKKDGQKRKRRIETSCRKTWVGIHNVEN